MSNDKTTLADVQPGGRVRLGDQALSTSELRRNAHILVLQEMRTRFTDAGSPSRTAALEAAIAALSAQPSPGGQGVGVSISDDDRAVLQRLQDALPTAGINGWAKGVEVLERLLRDSLAARQPVGEPGEDDEFLAGVCVALQCVTAQDSGVLWAEIVRAVGVDDLLQYAAFIEPEEWDLAGFSKYASTELHRRKPRSKASKQANRPPAKDVDLAPAPAAIPDTPEVRDILGRPNFWCSPWASILRRRGDVIPCKAEEEQAAVIRFMLNHYLAHGAGWADAAEAELQAIRYQVTRND